MNRLADILSNFRKEIPNFVATGIGELESGLELHAIAADPNFVTYIAAAAFTEVLKANAKGLDLLGLGSETVEDILITVKDAMVLLRMIGPNHYHGLAMGSKTPLAFARAIMKKYEPLLIEAVREIS